MMVLTLLTPRQRLILAEGARHKDGVVRPLIAAGYAGMVTRKTLKALAAAGLIEPNAHGDHYITEAGRAALDGGERP